MATSDVLTLDAARNTYLANANYRLTESTTEALAFVGAIKQLLLLLPKSGQFGGNSGERFEMDPATLQREQQDALAYVRSRRLASDPQIGYQQATRYRL